MCIRDRVYAGLGIALAASESHALLPRIRNFVGEHKHSPETPDLRALLASVRSHHHV